MHEINPPVVVEAFRLLMDIINHRLQQNAECKHLQAVSFEFKFAKCFLICHKTNISHAQTHKSCTCCKKWLIFMMCVLSECWYSVYTLVFPVIIFLCVLCNQPLFCVAVLKKFSSFRKLVLTLFTKASVI